MLNVVMYVENNLELYENVEIIFYFQVKIKFKHKNHKNEKGKIAIFEVNN